MVEVVHPKAPSKNIVKEHQAVFRIKECLGYSKLITFQDLSQQGFISETDSLEIVLGVRMCYYYDLYKRRETILYRMSSEINSQNAKIEELESLLYKTSTTSIKVEHQI